MHVMGSGVTNHCLQLIYESLGLMHVFHTTVKHKYNSMYNTVKYDSLILVKVSLRQAGKADLFLFLQSRI